MRKKSTVKTTATPNNSRSKSPFLIAMGWAWIIVLLDQLTKVLILDRFQVGDAQEVTGFFNLVRHHNPGAAFSFLADAGGWQRHFLLGVGVFAVVLILIFLWRNREQKLFVFSLSSILGGAIGNLIDRSLHGFVVDFLDFHWMGTHFPAFNVADSAITVGAICLILDELLRVNRQGKA